MTASEKRPVVLFGAGFAGTTHWIPGLGRSAPFELVGIVDPSKDALARAFETLRGTGVWGVPSVDMLPPSCANGTAIAFIATPDHFSVIKEAAQFGFRDFIVEKPLVSRLHEIRLLQELVGRLQLRGYSIDHYYQKFLLLEYALGRLSIDDPRAGWIRHEGMHRFADIRGCLGEIEGVTYTNIEAGDLGVPYLNEHPWIEGDPNNGGILRDLGPHAFAPLLRTGLISEDGFLEEATLNRLTIERNHFTPVSKEDDPEMFVRVLMVSGGITGDITFGKAPFPGKQRSLAVRGANGVFFAGLARGQSSVLMTNDGRVTRLSLVKAENDLVLEEAVAHFDGRLPESFDGNMAASCGALRLNERVRQYYSAQLASLEKKRPSVPW